eukprot:TRINITY_DN1527_c0_g1_i1.p1 TRINITY_DN1527_c0_g1~~TRINITY_DN1527_c0_g1_i1.p1  ORF type:complete len:245 (+),score=40.29 TRINITY_DN1527_c0_g1_i1:75-737(+)
MVATGYANVHTEDDYDQAHQQAQINAQMNAQFAMQAPMQEVQVVQQGPKLWKSGLCDCFATGGNLCCNVYWCTPCMAGRIHSSAVHNLNDTPDTTVCCGLTSAEILGVGLAVGVPLATNGAVHLPGSDMLGWCAISGYTWWQRQTIREKFGIHGDRCGDCLVSCFCVGCALCQHHTELSQQGINPGSCCCTVNPPLAQTQHVYAAHPSVVNGVQPAYVQN